MNQRWREGRASYKRPDEPIVTREHEVGPIGEREAKAFVVEHHYSRSYPAARWRFGLYHLGSLVGVSVFSHPCRDSILTNMFPGIVARDAVELGRFVLRDDVRGNGETWFLGRCFAALRGHVRGVLSLSDPEPRSTADGELIFPGHVGTIYQAHNGVYRGRGKAQSLRLLPDGRVFSQRSISKIRALERGWRYSAALLEQAGAPPLRDPDEGDAREWLERWLKRVTRPFRHRGNHRYAWRLDRRLVWNPERLPYPKLHGAT